MIAHQAGRNDIAVDLVRQAIAIEPNDPTYHLHLGEAYRSSGEINQAITCYKRGLALKHDDAEAQNNLGNLLAEKGEHDQAIGCYQQAISLNPQYAEAHNNLGNALMKNGQHEQAIACFERALELRPYWPEAMCNLGNALKRVGQSEEAIDYYRQSLALKRDDPQILSSLAAALKETGELEEAIFYLRKAASLSPNDPEVHNNLGIALAEQGQHEQAIDCHRQSLVLKADNPAAHNNLGIALEETGQHDEALACYRRALELQPDWAEVHTNLAQALLMQGEWMEGWKEERWRWRLDDPKSRPRSFPQPLWDGGDVHGNRILLHAEQGFGDTIQFARYAPLVVARGGRVIVECHLELHRLLQTLDGIDQLVARGQPLPPFDLHSPLMSLPLIFETTLQSIPSQAPYLHADPQASEEWRRKLSDDPAALKVGLAWAGNPRQKADRKRSMPLSAFAPLAQVNGVSFYSLQKGEAAAQAKNTPPGLKLIDWTEQLSDFADTAAFISQLDLVISVCTSVAHLAGAMGKPVWTLLASAADWRWLLGRDDSPWYPTMRLFRQSARGDWTGAMLRVIQALEELLRDPHVR
jgi:Flp pilus assembly protein TadD